MEVKHHTASGKAHFITLIGLVLIVAIYFMGKPINDFGNYYYGSKIALEGKESVALLYSDIHWFNEKVKSFGQEDFFGNHIPVPPFSILFYAPFTVFPPGTAKIIFNLFSLICFAFSFYRLQKKGPGIHPLALGLIFIFPLYNNMVQGQAYLLITAMIIEVWLNYKEKRIWISALFIALLFHLKLFPAAIALYFIFTREFRLLLISSCITLGMALLTAAFTGWDAVINYYTVIVPRLFSGEVIDPFYYGHQGLDVVLKQLFVSDALHNPNPLANVPLLVPVVKGVISGFIFYTLYKIVIARKDAVVFFFTVLCFLLLSAYVPNYSFVMLLPFAAFFHCFNRKWIILALLFLVVSIPMSLFTECPEFVKYSRILLMITLWAIIFTEMKRSLQLTSVFVSMIFFTGVFSLQYANEANNYMRGAKADAVYYGIEQKGDAIVLKRCGGYKDESDTVFFKGSVIEPLNLSDVDEKKFPDLFVKRQNVKDVFLVNYRSLLFLSDLNQGVGMYKPRMINH
jgi:hypothetical protein